MVCMVLFKFITLAFVRESELKSNQIHEIQKNAETLDSTRVSALIRTAGSGT